MRENKITYSTSAVPTTTTTTTVSPRDLFIGIRRILLVHYFIYYIINVRRRMWRRRANTFESALA